MVGQSTKTFPSRPSSHPEPGDTQAAGGGLKVKELNRSPSSRILHPSLEQTYRDGRGESGGLGVLLRAFGLFVVAVTPGLFWDFVGERGGVEAAPVGALTPSCCHLLSVLSCHLAVTFHLLGTEQKHSAGT